MEKLNVIITNVSIDQDTITDGDWRMAGSSLLLATKVSFEGVVTGEPPCETLKKLLGGGYAVLSFGE